MFFSTEKDGTEEEVQRKISILDDITSQCPIVWGK